MGNIPFCNFRLRSVLCMQIKFECGQKPIVEEGVFSETELGIIGAVLFLPMQSASLQTAF